jgi:hypothetical protein
VYTLEMPVVGAELFGGNLPVAVNHGTMSSGGYLGSGAAAVQQQVQVPPHFSQVILQGNGISGERRENQISIGGDPIGFEKAPLGFVETR